MKKILIIEDNVDIAGLMRDMLVKEGFDVATCEDGYQGVQLTHKGKPDLIILDLMLPAGGGFTVLQNIKLSMHTRSIPVVVLTASKDSAHKEKAMKFGVDAYLEKPYDSKQLVETIRTLLEKREETKE